MPQNRLAAGHKSFIPKGLDCVPCPCSTPFLIARRLKGVKRLKTQADGGLTPADEAGYVVLRQPPASKLANLFKIDISEVEWPGAALRSWQAGAVQFTAKICGLVGRATMADPPSAGGAFLALCRLVAEKPTGWQNGGKMAQKGGKMATFVETCYVTVYDATPLLPCRCVYCRPKERGIVSRSYRCS